MHTMETVIEPLRCLDWNDVEAVESATRKSFELLAAQKYLLRRELTTLPDNPDLAALCEHYDILDKIVLHDDPETGIRLRLHIFGPGYHDRPHNHRWTYASTSCVANTGTGSTATSNSTQRSMFRACARSTCARNGSGPATRCTTALFTPWSPNPAPYRWCCAALPSKTGSWSWTPRTASPGGNTGPRRNPSKTLRRNACPRSASRN